MRYQSAGVRLDIVVREHEHGLLDVVAPLVAVPAKGNEEGLVVALGVAKREGNEQNVHASPPRERVFESGRASFVVPGRAANSDWLISLWSVPIPSFISALWPVSP